MNTLRIALPLAALLIAAPAFAQPAGHDDHHPAAAAATDKADDMAMHERCKAVMGSKMDAKHPHDHMRDKQGMMSHPKGVPPTAAEMQKMHEQCAAMMAKAPDAPPAPKK